MNKNEYLTAVGNGLSGFDKKDIDKSLEYLSEMIDDRIEDGIPEEEAVAGMESPAEAANHILMDTSLTKLVKARVMGSGKLKAWEIVLLAVGSPVWASLLLAAIAVFASIYITLWAIVLTVYVVDFSFAAGGIAGIVQCAVSLFTGNPVAAAFYTGAGLILFGLSVFLFFGANKNTVSIILISKKLFLWVKSQFVRKEKVK